MSTFPDPKYRVEGNKLLVNLMLKVPIEIELEISQNLPTEYCQLLSQEVHNQTDNFEEITIKDKLSQSKSIEDVLISSTQLKQIVAQAIENNEVLSSLSVPEYHNQEPHSEDSLLKHEPIDQFCAQESNTPSELLTSLPEYDDRENHSEDKLLKDEPIDQFCAQESNTSSELLTSLREYDDRENHSEDSLLKHEPIDQFCAQESNTSSELTTAKFDKQSVAHVVDLFNDGLVFTVNTIGAVLFLGKVANYSWEGDNS